MWKYVLGFNQHLRKFSKAERQRLLCFNLEPVTPPLTNSYPWRHACCSFHCRLFPHAGGSAMTEKAREIIFGETTLATWALHPEAVVICFSGKWLRTLWEQNLQCHADIRKGGKECLHHFLKKDLPLANIGLSLNVRCIQMLWLLALYWNTWIDAIRVFRVFSIHHHLWLARMQVVFLGRTLTNTISDHSHYPILRPAWGYFVFSIRYWT